MVSFFVSSTAALRALISLSILISSSLLLSRSACQHQVSAAHELECLAEDLRPHCCRCRFNMKFIDGCLVVKQRHKPPHLQLVTHAAFFQIQIKPLARRQLLNLIPATQNTRLIME